MASVRFGAGQLSEIVQANCVADFSASMDWSAVLNGKGPAKVSGEERFCGCSSGTGVCAGEIFSATIFVDRSSRKAG
jgi:hypothetical protein